MAKRKSLYVMILDQLAEIPDVPLTVEEVHQKFKDYSLETVQKQLDALVNDKLVVMDELEITEQIIGLSNIIHEVPTAETEEVYRISYEGYRFVESKEQQHFANKMAMNAEQLSSYSNQLADASNRLNSRILLITVMTGIISLASVYVNYRTLPILERANEIQVQYLKEANDIQTRELKEANQIQEKILKVTVPDTVAVRIISSPNVATKRKKQ